MTRPTKVPIEGGDIQDVEVLLFAYSHNVVVLVLFFDFCRACHTCQTLDPVGAWRAGLFCRRRESHSARLSTSQSTRETVFARLR